MTEILTARLVVHRPDSMTTRQRKSVAKWLRMQASALEGSDNYGRRYTARYFTRVTDKPAKGGR